MQRISKAIARFIEHNPWWFIVIAALLSAAAVPGITLLETDTGFNALVSPEAEISLDNARYQTQFGGEPITILLTGQLDDIFSTGNLATMSDFEQEFSHDERYRELNSPLTILQIARQEAERASQTLQEQLALTQEQAAAEAMQAAAAMGLDELQQEQAAEQARAEVLQSLQPQIEQIQEMGEPSLANPAFIASVLYDASGEINPMLQSFIPDDGHVLIIATPQGNMSDEQALQATVDIENFFSANPLEKVDVIVASSSKLVDAISNGIGNNIKILLGLSVAVMVIILLSIFRVRWRLLSLLMVGISALWTFGLMGYLSIPLTMATMAVLPILIGLGIDFSVQFHNRYQEEIIKHKTTTKALISSISRMLPVVGIALLATIIGFITLYMSEVPMIRDFGMVLAIGIVFSYIVALFLLHSIIYLADRRVPIKRLREAASKSSGRIERILLRLGKLAINHTLWIFVISLAFAIGGGIVDHWLPTNTDYEELMPQDTPALTELRELREITGTAGTIKFMIEADDVTRLDTLDWMKEYEDEALLSHPELISTSSLATLVSGAAGGVIPAQQQIDTILIGTPADYLERLLSSDHSMASVSFNIKYIPMEETHDLLQKMQEEAKPPEGVQVSPVGSLVLGVSTVDAVVGSRLTMNLICLGAIFVILILVYRHIKNPIYAIIPVGAVIAWSSLDMYLLNIPLNPLTSILGVLVISICTEFMVLLLGRYDEEKRLGLPPQDAMVTAISKIGRAIVTTALTTMGGFGILIASNFVMIRDFGIATLLGVLLCLVITLTVMPGLIVWYDEWRSRHLQRRQVKRS